MDAKINLIEMKRNIVIMHNLDGGITKNGQQYRNAET